MAAIEVSTVSRYMCTANCMCERVCGYDVRQYASLTLYCVNSIAGSSCRRVHDNQESFYVSIFFLLFCFFCHHVFHFCFLLLRLSACCCLLPCNLQFLQNSNRQNRERERKKKNDQVSKAEFHKKNDCFFIGKNAVVHMHMMNVCG